MGRGKYEYWLTDDGLLLIGGWARDGLTEEQIAKNIGVTRKTLFNWRQKHLPILHALKESKEIADREVENALYKKATGYTTTITKPMKVKKAYIERGIRKELEEIVQVDTEVHIPPDVTAMIYWLKNRKRDTWRDRPDVSTDETLKRLDEVLGKIGGNI